MLTDVQMSILFKNILKGRITVIGELLNFSEEKKTELEESIMALTAFRKKNNIYSDSNFLNKLKIYRDDIVRIIQENGDPESIKEISNIQFKNMDHYENVTPLHLMAEKGFNDYYYIFVKLGANINSKYYKTKILFDNYNIPLHILTKGWHPETLESLMFSLKEEGKINSLNGDGRSLLDFYIAMMHYAPAGHSNYLRYLPRLVDAGAEFGEKSTDLSQTGQLLSQLDITNSSNIRNIGTTVDELYEEANRIVASGNPLDIGRKYVMSVAINNGLKISEVANIMKIKIFADALYLGNQEIIKEYLPKIEIDEALPRIQSLCKERGISPYLAKKGLNSIELNALRDVVGKCCTEHLVVGIFTQRVVEVQNYTSPANNFVERITAKRAAQTYNDIDLD